MMDLALVKRGLRMDERGSREFAFIFFAACLVLNAVCLSFAYKRVFYAYNDYDGYINMAWRILSGHRIYTDFFYHSGFVFPYTMALFLFLFGVNKYAILIELLFSSSVPVALVYLMVRKRISLWMTSAAVLLTAFTFHWGALFPDYTHDAVLWVVAAIWILSREGAFRDPRRAFLAGFGGGAAVLMSVLTKENTGIPFLPFLVAVLICEEHREASLKGFLCALLSAVLVFVLVTFPHPLAYVKTATDMQGIAAQSRLQCFLHAGTYLGNLYLVFPLFLVPVISAVLRVRKKWIILLAGTLAAGIVSSATSSGVSSTSDLPFWGPLFALTAVILAEIKPQTLSGWKRIRRAACVGLLVLTGFVKAGFALSENLVPVLSNPPGDTGFASTLPEPIKQRWKEDYEYRFKTPAFKGWYCNRQYAEPLDYYVDFVKNVIPPAEKLLIYGDLQLVYALTGRKPLYKLPLKFSRTTITKDQAEIIRNEILSSPPDWVIVNFAESDGDNYRLIDEALGLDNFWQTKYTAMTHSQAWVLLHRKE